MIWHAVAVRLLRASNLFTEVQLIGGKVRGTLDAGRFLDIHFDPTTSSYSYAIIDLALPYPGDKRLFGWDDFPHPGDLEKENLASHPHHFQERMPDGEWRFRESSFRGDIEAEIPIVLHHIKGFLESGV
ncbi:MAG: DUF6516 family protein [Anaerolineales bacterium]|jgi:hypothetical protein